MKSLFESQMDLFTKNVRPEVLEWTEESFDREWGTKDQIIKTYDLKTTDRPNGGPMLMITFTRSLNGKSMSAVVTITGEYGLINVGRMPHYFNSTKENQFDVPRDKDYEEIIEAMRWNDVKALPEEFINEIVDTMKEVYRDRAKWLEKMHDI